MKLNLYDENLNRIAIIGERYVSCLWSEGYNSCEPFTLEVQDSGEYRKKIQPDCYVGREDRKTLMVIKSVRVEGGHIIATGFQAVRCLDDVAFIGTIAGGAPITQSIRDAYGDSEGFHLIAFGEDDLTDTYPEEISNKSILQLMETMCPQGDIGFRAVRGDGGIRVEFYKPEEREDLVFSQQYGNLSVQSVLRSTEQLRNHAIVLADGVTVEADHSGGAQKRSLILDSPPAKEDGESAAAYRKRLLAYGAEELAKQKRTWECSFTPYGGDFGTRYDLGDVLTVLLPEYGLRFHARITRFTQKSQKNATTTTVEVGEITIVR